MSQIRVLIAATFADLQVTGIVAAVKLRSDMELIVDRVIDPNEIGAMLERLNSAERCALLIVGSHIDTLQHARLLTERPNLVVLCVDVTDEVLKIELRDLRLDALLGALRELLGRAGAAPSERVTRIQLRPAHLIAEARGSPLQFLRERPLLAAAIDWIHAILRHALHEFAANGASGDLPGLSVTPATITALLDKPASPDWGAGSKPRLADAALTQSLTPAADRAEHAEESLAVLVRGAKLDQLEVRFLLLALAPELDHRYQRCFGLLLDDLGRRVSTVGLCASLLGNATEVRCRLAEAGSLLRWRLIESRTGALPCGDDPVRVDPSLVEWLLGDATALARDPRIRRALQETPWPGTTLVADRNEIERAARVVAELRERTEAPQFRWIALTGDPATGWRAVLERACELASAHPIRVEPARLLAVDAAEIEETACRLGRLACLARRPLFLDAISLETTPQGDEILRALLGALDAFGQRAAVLCTDAARVVRLLGPVPVLVMDYRTDVASRGASVQTAAKSLAVEIPSNTSESLAQLYPLHADGFEHAVRLAHARGAGSEDEGQRLKRFISACQDVAAEGTSRLSDRINPTFQLSDVVLPPERFRQLTEIVDAVRLSKRVLDDWRFREQLPYGRAVTALFHGSSGCGKTMSALAIARELGLQVLKLDLSRIVSKYVGETEKNIDRIFSDARNCGAAILIDEADALLGKRSEIRDAQDRHANVEVAYLLQRIEAYEEGGLAIFTTNLRQNIDSAFLRRLRFVIDFPRPDPAAREEIWRRCLPASSHALNDADFRQLARKIDLTGGHISQIALRAAFTAAAADSHIGLAHIAHASRAEMAKLGLPPAQLDLPANERVA